MRKTLLVGTCLVVGAGAAWLAFTIDQHVRGWAFAMPGTTDTALAPSTFPRLILWLVVILALANALVEARRPPAAEGAAEAPQHARVLLLLLATLGGYLLLHWLGFILRAVLVVGGGPLAMGYRNWRIIAVTTLLLSVGTWALFRYGMKVILPPFTLS